MIKSSCHQEPEDWTHSHTHTLQHIRINILHWLTDTTLSYIYICYSIVFLLFMILDIWSTCFSLFLFYYLCFFVSHQTQRHGCETPFCNKPDSVLHRNYNFTLYCLFYYCVISKIISEVVMIMKQSGLIFHWLLVEGTSWRLTSVLTYKKIHQPCTTLIILRVSHQMWLTHIQFNSCHNYLSATSQWAAHSMWGVYRLYIWEKKTCGASSGKLADNVHLLVSSQRTIIAFSAF